MRRWILPVFLVIMMACGGSAAASSLFTPRESAERDVTGYWYLPRSGGNAYFLYEDGDIGMITGGATYTFDGETVMLRLDGAETPLAYEEGTLRTEGEEIIFIPVSAEEGSVAGMWFAEDQDNYELFLYEDGTATIELIEGTYQVSGDEVTFTFPYDERVFYLVEGMLVYEEDDMVISRDAYDGELAGVWRAEDAEDTALVLWFDGTGMIYSPEEYFTSVLYAVAEDWLVATDYSGGPRSYQLLSENTLYSPEEDIHYIREEYPSPADGLQGKWHALDDSEIGAMTFYLDNTVMLYDVPGSEYIHGTFEVDDEWVTLLLEDDERVVLQIMDEGALHFPNGDVDFVREDLLP